MQQRPNEIEIVPYLEINGCRTLTDAQMGEIYDKMQENGYIERIFFNGYPKTKNEFLMFVKNPLNSVFVAMENKKIVLITWINEIVGKRGTIGFCSFPDKFARKKIIAEKKILTLVFSFLSVVIALIPDPYEDVKKFVRLLGFKNLGTIPNASYFVSENKEVGTNVQYITKAMLEGQNG